MKEETNFICDDRLIDEEINMINNMTNEEFERHLEILSEHEYEKTTI